MGGRPCARTGAIGSRVAVDELAIARAEFVIEAEILPHETMQEDINTHTGKAMPEIPRYTGDAIPPSM